MSQSNDVQSSVEKAEHLCVPLFCHTWSMCLLQALCGCDPLFQVTYFCIFHAVDFVEEEASVNGSASFSSSDWGG